MNGVLNSATGESFSVVLARLQGEGATGVLTLIDSATGQKASVRLLEGRVAEAALGTAEGAAALDAMSGLDSWWYRFQSGAVSEPKERGVTATLKPTASPVPSAGTPSAGAEAFREPKSKTAEDGWNRFTFVSGELAESTLNKEQAAYHREDCSFFRDQARRLGSRLGLLDPRVLALVEPERISTLYWEVSPWVVKGVTAPGGVGLERLLTSMTGSK